MKSGTQTQKEDNIVESANNTSIYIEKSYGSFAGRMLALCDTTNVTIQHNYSVVKTNEGTIVNNFSTNVVTNSGSILNNYFVKDNLWGKNNFYRIDPNQTKDALDWSLNPAELSADGDYYVGAPDNENATLRGATFKAAAGYRITLNETQGTEFTDSDNGDGTYSIAIAPLIHPYIEKIDPISYTTVFEEIEKPDNPPTTPDHNAFVDNNKSDENLVRNDG